MKKNKTILSLFSGCGGMDLGFEGDFDVLSESVNPNTHPDLTIRDGDQPGWVRLKSTGFKTVFSNDINPHAQAAWIPFFEKRGSLPEAFHLGSLVDYVKDAKNNGKNIFPDSVDVVTGGFPCQDFSVAGKRKGFDSHKSHNGTIRNENEEPGIENRGRLYIWMREVISIVRPKLFVAENVKGLVSLANVKEVIEEDFRNIGEEGYLVVPGRVLNAPKFGVPQTRERVIFFGFSRSALKKEAIEALSKNPIPHEYDPYPVPSHSYEDKHYPLFQSENKLMPAVTAGQAFKGLEEPEYSLDHSQKEFSRAKWYGDHCQGNRELSLNAPGPTIRSEHHGNIEFRRLSKSHGGIITEELSRGLKERRLTLRECARLQTFPDNFEFVRKSKDKPDLNLTASSGYKLVGNAVPPLLAYHIAKRLETIWPKLFKTEGKR